MGAKVWIAFARAALAFAVLLLGAAGTLQWPAAWAFMALLFGGSLVITRMLARHDPALLRERMKPPIQKDQPPWDRVLMLLLIPLWLAWLVLMGLDAVRFGWSAVPVWLQWIGAAGVALALWIWHRTFQVNTFASAAVRIQTEREHKVVSTGPYAIVRHPMYAGALIFFPSTALLLGSWWGLAAAFVLAGILAVRTVMEDRELHHRLDGYRPYAARVRYRLIPLIW
jgi:protein-S-isoprenylcysteine O-methyltransferase Ste14